MNEITKIEDSPEEQASTAPDSNDVYFLGGNDREMSRIALHLKRSGAEVASGITTWEKADASVHKDVIRQVTERGGTPVGVELRGAEDVDGLVDIDHHNAKSDRPASILQILERLNIEPRLADRMVAANDAAYIPGMDKLIKEELERRQEEGVATDRLVRTEKWLNVMKEMIRRGDREAQGVTAEMEIEAEIAIANAEQADDGTLIVRLTGDRCSPVTDRLYNTWQNGEQKLVVICNEDKDVKEVWYFGDGQLCQDLAEHFKSVRQQRIESGQFVEPPVGQPRGEYHSFSGGQGRGKRGENAQALVVASNPAEVIDFIVSHQASQN